MTNERLLTHNLPLLERNSLRATGTVTLTMIVNLKRFVRRGGSDVVEFERVRGTEALARYLRALPKHITSPFVHDLEERDLLEAAHRMRIFRGYVLSTYFFPTYHLDEDALIAMPDRLPGDTVLVETFPVWDYQVSLTRNGFAVVRMIRHFEDTPLEEIAGEVQRVQRAQEQIGIGYTYAESRSSWRVAMDVTAILVGAIGGCMEFPDDHGRWVRIAFDPERRMGRLPLHDRYMTIQLDDVRDGAGSIPPDAMTGEYSSFALGLMRLGTALRGGAGYDMRRRRPVSTADLRNLSPWRDDLCLASNDAMLIYSRRNDAGAPGDDLPEYYTRPHYWQGVARGVEWLVTLKTELQLVERQSTELLTSVSDLTARVNDGLLSEEDKGRLNALAEGVSLAFNIIPQLRYALVPASISHATDAVYVFSHIVEQLGLHRISAHVGANMNELSSFLTYYSSTQLQYESREREAAENRTGLTISIMLILLSLVSVPSLIKDASEIDWGIVSSLPSIQLGAVIVLSLLPIVLLVITASLAARMLGRRR